MTSVLDISALRTPWENRLLFAKLSSYCFFADPFGADHIPRVRWALEQSWCSRLLGTGSVPDLRKKIVAHIGNRFHGRGTIRVKDIEEDVIQAF